MDGHEAMNQKSSAAIATGDSLRSENTPTSPLAEDEKQIEKRLVRKIDVLILPIIAFSFYLSIIDRGNYGAARLQHLESDLHMSGSQFQAALSVFYAGNILFGVPSNMLLNHFGRPSLHIGLAVLFWGMVTSCTAAVNNFGGMMACRTFLGIAEAPLHPGMLFYLSKWYKKTELSLRISICLSAGLVAAATGPLIAAGVLNGLDGARGLSAWRWLYLIEGIVSICGGLALIAFLPDFPHTWTALTPRTREIGKSSHLRRISLIDITAIRRLTLDASETDLDHSDISAFDGVKLALRDEKLYILSFIQLCNIVSIGSQSFYPTMAATLGYSHVISLLLVAPPYFYTTIHCCIHSYLSDRSGRRFWYAFYPAPIAVAGFAIYMSPVTSFGARYFSLFLMLSVYCMNMTISAWCATAIARPPAKRAAAYGFLTIISHSGSIWTPFTYRDEDLPYFRLALGINAGMMVTAAALAILLRVIMARANRRLDEEEKRLRPTAFEIGGDISLTQVRGFRYTI
ncbi:major facilitator superfamily domain-containing protein [Aspergillus spinulosporus]